MKATVFTIAEQFSRGKEIRKQ